MIWTASDYERIDPRLFRGFLAVVKAGSINKAAQLTHLSPSAVAQQVGKLEDRLQTALFTRTHSAMVLTATGQKLADFADHWLRLTNEFAEQVSHETAAMQGLVSYSMPESCIHSPHFGWLLDKRQSCPDIRLSIALKPTADVCADLLAGDVDFGFLTERVNNEQLVLYPFCQESYVWVGSSQAPITFSCLDDLIHLPFVRYPGVEALIDRWAKTAFPGTPAVPSLADMDVRGTFNDIRGALAMVRGGLGVTLVAQHVAQADLDAGTVQAIFTDTTPISQQIFIARVRQRYMPARVRKVIRWFLEMHADLQAVPEEFLA